MQILNPLTIDGQVCLLLFKLEEFKKKGRKEKNECAGVALSAMSVGVGVAVKFLPNFPNTINPSFPLLCFALLCFASLCVCVQHT